MRSSCTPFAAEKNGLNVYDNIEPNILQTVLIYFYNFSIYYHRKTDYIIGELGPDF